MSHRSTWTRIHLRQRCLGFFSPPRGWKSLGLVYFESGYAGEHGSPNLNSPKAQLRAPRGLRPENLGHDRLLQEVSTFFSKIAASMREQCVQNVISLFQQTPKMSRSVLALSGLGMSTNLTGSWKSHLSHVDLTNS